MTSIRSKAIVLAILTPFYIGLPILCPSDQVINFSASGANFMSIVSQSKYSSPNLAQFFVRNKYTILSMGGILALRSSIRIFQTWSYRPAASQHLDISNFLKCLSADTDWWPKIYQQSTGLSGNFEKSADGRLTAYGLQLTSTIYRLMSSVQKDDTML